MSEIEGLSRAYDRFVRLPWDKTLAGPQKVWFAIYEPNQERRLRLRLRDFEIKTKAAGFGWVLHDLTSSFAHWMAAHEYREAYFEEPDDMELALHDYSSTVANEIIAKLTAPEVNNQTVVAIMGLASLFGLARASTIFEIVAPHIRGRLLVFFPGQHEGSNYRLLDARDGWNYLAVPITATEEK
ncbi:MAG: DUF1788 domain-containing protein [Chloroflexota bacterium]|nr:DUF1788 domain-containing protein [Chloroflexota bacterium]